MTETPARRALSFASLEQVVVEAERLAQGAVRTSGNHSFGQILEHLALTHDMATGKITPPPLPFFMRMMMPLLRGRILNSVPKPGFKLPKASEAFFWPDGDVDVPQALKHLEASVENYRKVGPLPVHPIFGAATREQNDRLNCGHCAMHLSFVHPA